jgi:hypothetical protein
MSTACTSGEVSTAAATASISSANRSGCPLDSASSKSASA